MAINQYILEVDSGAKSKFVISYKNGAFLKLEHKTGKLADERQWDNFMKLIPQLEAEIPDYQNKIRVGTITYTLIENKKPISLFSQMIDEYFIFFEKQTDLPPRINAVEGKSLKDIIKHLQSICTDDVEVMTVWKTIFLNWHKVEPFYAKQMQLKQINSNISNILTQVKNGNGNNTAQRASNNNADDLRRSL